MATANQRQIVRYGVAWMIATVLLVAIIGSFQFKHWFAISLIGFLVIVHLTSPVYVMPAWRRRLKWPVAVGILIFMLHIIHTVW